MSEFYALPENPQYHEDIRKITREDTVDADEVVNPLIEKMLENTHAVKKDLDTHNTDADAHPDLRELVGSGVEEHNYDENAHADIRALVNEVMGTGTVPSMVGVAATDGGAGNLDNGLDYGIRFDYNGNAYADFSIGNNSTFQIRMLDNNETQTAKIQLGGGMIQVFFANGKTIRIRDTGIQMNGLKVQQLIAPTAGSDAATKSYVDKYVPKIYPVTIPATAAGAAGTVAQTFPECVANENTCIVDAVPAAASQTAFYECGFRVTGITTTGLTYTVDYATTTAMTVYVSVQEAIAG